MIGGRWRKVCIAMMAGARGRPGMGGGGDTMPDDDNHQFLLLLLPWMRETSQTLMNAVAGKKPTESVALHFDVKDVRDIARALRWAADHWDDR